MLGIINDHPSMVLGYWDQLFSSTSGPVGCMTTLSYPLRYSPIGVGSARAYYAQVLRPIFWPMLGALKTEGFIVGNRAIPILTCVIFFIKSIKKC